MGRYFGREPRYSQEEAEAQAKQALEAAMSKGRPPEDEWKALGPRMADINRELATRPPAEIPPPPPPRRRTEPETPGAEAPRPRRPMNQILRPPPPPAEAPAPTKRAPRATKPPGATKSTMRRPG